MIAAMLGALTGIGLRLDDLFDVIRYFLGLSLFVMPALLFVPLMLASTFRAVYGRELWRSGGFEINSQSAPDHLGQNLSTLTIPQLPGGKRHMLYNSSECVDHIVRCLVD